MTLLIGTREGLYRASDVPFDDAERVLDSGWTLRIRQFDALDGVFAAGTNGLFRSTDGGRSWDRLPVPETSVWEPFAARDGRLYAGTQPACLFVSIDEGETWDEIETFGDHPSRDLWRSAFGDPRVRGIGVHPDAPDRVFVGVEAGGLYRSEDAGATWSGCRIRNQTDIHQVLPIDADTVLVPCGRLSIYDRNHAAAEGGLYLTTDAGVTWCRLDESVDPSYFRSALVHDGTLYACGALTVPPEWHALGAEASLFESSNLGETFEEVPYPGGPDEIVLAWETGGGRVFGGTAAGPAGRVVERGADGWRTVGTVPADIHSLSSL